MTTIEILEALRAHFGGVTDYRIAKIIGARQQLISQWRMGHVMSDNWAIKVADAWGKPRAYVLACVNAERAKDEFETSGVWRQIADAFKDKAAALAFVALLGFTGFAPSPAHAFSGSAGTINIYYVKY